MKTTQLRVTDNSLMLFGKHKGVKMANVPASYLIWLYEEKEISKNLKDYIGDNMDCLKKEVAEKKLIRQSY